ncbi:MAG: hypothetical protein ILO36_03835, partial [Abditibacteriota bacterium]|nr:hypothetical protein [Abditibacteriota bacterium]
MKKLIIFWAVVLLSVPVLGQELARKYLDTRITLTEAAVAMPELCKALSEASGATIIPDEDWRVKERQMTIYCHDALLPHVMYSIVDVTRFMWNVKDENTYVLTYRADTDRLIGETQRKGEAAKADRGAALVENSMRHQGEDMNSLRKNNPAAYLMKSTGLGDAIGKSLKASPQLFKSAASGEKRVFSGDEISPETLSGIDELNSLILELANDVCSARNVRVPGVLSDTLSKPVSRGNVEIEVNGDIPIGRDRKITSEQINTVCSGYAVVRTDGVITGVLPIVNTNSEITKNLAEVALDLIENPGKSFDEVFAGLDVNAFMGAIGRDLMSVNNVYK